MDRKEIKNKSIMTDVRKFIREEFQEEIKEVKDPMQEKSKDEILQDILDNALIDLKNKDYPEPPDFLSIKNDMGEYSTVFSPGNISAITGKAKAKKTFVQTMIIATLAKNNVFDETIKANLPKGKRNVVLFDTEQSVFFTAKINKRVNALNEHEHDNLKIYSLRGTDAKTLMELVEKVTNDDDNIGVLFIDQVADLARSINDEEEAVSVVRNLERISKEKELHICCIIHQNKNDNYATGWLGSQMLKKSESIISVTKSLEDEKLSIVEADATRGLGFKEFKIYIDGHGLPRIYREYEEIVNPNQFVETEKEDDDFAPIQGKVPF